MLRRPQKLVYLNFSASTLRLQSSYLVTSVIIYWVILRGALDGDIFLEKCTVKNVQEVTTAFKAEHSVEPTDEPKCATNEIDIERASISKCMSFDIEHPSMLKVNLATGQHTPMIRCHIGITGLKTAIPHDLDVVEPLPIDHLRGEEMRVHSTGDWFASALTVLSTSSQTMLWNYKVPTAIFAFSQRESILCGVLALLCIIDESATPEWATKYNDEEEERETVMRKLRESSRAMMREMSLSPAEKAKAFRERVSKKHDEWFEGLNAIRRRGAQRADTRIVEAVQSPKWDNKLVAEHNLLWLKWTGHVQESHDLRRAVEVLLWRMVKEPPFARDLAHTLD
ncbi:uncharacterized protein L3040_004301 [Drepanopeziza brunnea f. sp. 'multigermtubi']|uniref:Uncharacterized protein n=1 Tax=Marssonina brunnea f. sp. multigermtubi (strain MB_m1) TaxID=1072389 RepID=K1Y5F2_MARBU|nr:uncharacterized protein MBM_01096 [Drepanopeziza brunnea f. sp. 'multigermtubi' MB_m1]EKD20414.1 hypothetical protein MBM_01096 [Drepanopeziza brunnea f. sp. 'multigermtubi' MB_m1]KAJ5042910.1 hypothetical protein L3040_004301 [Drepanopeziza brunnea f. sp. 'multigermtubi']